MEWNQLAETLLLKAKMGAPTEAIEAKLAQAADTGQLAAQLHTDEQRKAFWINIYNACFLILRRRDKVDKPAIFRDKLVAIAGHAFSLDDIEHGILRKYRYKFSLGFLPDPFAPQLIRRLAVSKRDYRIHFALNCGAESCPPIAFYHPEKLDSQLDMATLSFLEAETIVSEEKGEVYVSRLLRWYLGDFGGYSGIRQLLRNKLGIDSRGLRIRFREYNWDEKLDNWTGN